MLIPIQSICKYFNMRIVPVYIVNKQNGINNYPYLFSNVLQIPLRSLLCEETSL